MIDGSIAEGTQFVGIGKKITAARLMAFSGGPFTEPKWPRTNIHTDTEFAKSTGLPSRCASGTQFHGHMVEFLITLFGQRWFESGTINVKFVDLVLEDHVVTPHCKVLSRERPEKGDATRIELEVWCEREDGRKVMTGTAGCLVD